MITTFFSSLVKIWLIWHPSILVTVILKSLQMVTVDVTWPSPQSYLIISIIYASNDAAERTLLWSELLDLATTHRLGSKAWLILGDFNQIRDPFERANFCVAPTCGRANLLWSSQISYTPIALMKHEYLILPFCIFEIINLNHKKFEIQISNFQNFKFSNFQIFKNLNFGYYIILYSFT